MKNNLIFFASLLFLLSCADNNSNDEKLKQVVGNESTEISLKSKLIGEWKYQYRYYNDITGKTLKISNDGDFLAINYSAASFTAASGSVSSDELNFLGTYKNGSINIDSERFGNIKYSEQKDVLYFEDNIYERVIEKVEIKKAITKKRPFRYVTPFYKKEVLLQKSKDELQIIRNEVFARKGYIFEKGGDMDIYFSKLTWYDPRLKNVDDLLTENERQYILLIQSIENPSSRFKITEDNLRLRDSPSLDAVKITNLPMGTVVRYLNEKSNNKVEVQIDDAPVLNYWYKVQTDIGEIGWIHGCCFQQL